MASKIQCDRCKKISDTNYDAPDHPYSTVSIRDAIMPSIHLSESFAMAMQKPKRTAELCTTCTDSLMEFLDGVA